MATAGTERYSRINLIVVDGGTKLTRRMFLKRVDELSNPGQHDIINTFLGNCKQALLETTTGRNNVKKLYPPSGCTTTLDGWDLYLLCFILQEVCHLNYINRKDIEKLQRMRNDLCHLSDPTLDEIPFQTQLKEIKIIFKRSLQIVRDPEFEIELNQLVQKYEHGPIYFDDIVRLHHHYSKLELERNERFDDFIDSQKESNARIEQGIDSLMSRLDGLARLLPEDTVVKVPGATMILEVNNCTEERESSILRLLVKLFEEKILNTELFLSEDLSELATQDLREAVAKLFNEFKAKGRHIVKVEQKCLLLEVQCDTIAAFVELVNDVRNHRLVNEFQDTVQAIKCLDGYEHVIFNIEISCDEIIRVLDELVTVLEKTVFTVLPVKSKGEPKEEQSTFSEKSYVKLTTSLVKVDQPANVKKLMPGEFRKGLKQIQDKLRRTCDLSHLSITARVTQQPIDNDYYSKTTSPKTSSMTAESQCKTESKRIPEELVTSTDSKIPEIRTENKLKEQRDIPEEVVTSRDNKIPKQTENKLKEQRGISEVVVTSRDNKIPEQDPDSLKCYFDSRFDFVASIDIGTTYSGYAFAYQGGHIGTSRFSSNALVTTKTPTTVLLRRDRKFHSFGYEAENKYSELADKGEHEDWYFFQRFKMQAVNQGLTREIQLTDIRGKKMRAIEIFSMAINYMKEQVLMEIARSFCYGKKEEFPIRWVITVPAIWTDAAKQIMREAGEMAGIKQENLLIGMESECASIYCRKLNLVVPGERYLVLDLGGGTVDTTVHELNSDDTMRELYKASGGAWGGSLVNEKYFELFDTLCGPDLMKEFKENYMDEFLDMDREFEEKKRCLRPEDVIVRVRLPNTLIELIREKTGTWSLESLITIKGMEKDLKINTNKMNIDIAVIEKMFQPSVRSIISLVNEVMEGIKDRPLDKIVMVGGFSENQLVIKAIKHEFPDTNVISPEDSGLAVLRGAVFLCCNPTPITTRVIKHTYGLAARVVFIDGFHPDDKREELDNRVFCKDVFSKFVEANSSVSLGKNLSRTYDIYEKEKPLEIDVYESERENVLYVTDTTCRQIGQLIINTPKDCRDKNAKVKVEFIFGQTELAVRVVDLQSEKIYNALVNYL